MLVLTRKLDESIKIGDSVVVKIIALQDGQVKIGIEAPKEIKIYRMEIIDEIQRTNAEAAAVSKTAAVNAARALQKKLPGGDPAKRKA